MGVTGLGQDGFIRYQKEVTFNTPSTASMVDLPVNPDSKITGKHAMIANDVQIGMRHKQDPDIGREIVAGAFNLAAHPSLIGGLINMLLGASDVDTDNADGTYTHAWIQNLTGVSEGTSFTLQQALGGDLAENFTGCTITALHLEADNEGHIKLSFDVVGKEYTADIARVTTFTYPSFVPLNFSHLTLNINPDGVTAFDVNVTSLKLDIDTNADTERFKTGSDSILQPVYKGVPIVNLSCDLDADQKFVDYARAQTSAFLTLAITSTEAASGTTMWAMGAELPRAFLSADTEIPNTQEYMTMSVDFDCSYGEVSTNSGTDHVMFELTCTDTTAAYTA